MMIKSRVDIKVLIEIVSRGGRIKTGIDVYNSKGVLLLEKNVLVSSVKPLEIIKKQGITFLPLNTENYGGIWDGEGKYIDPESAPITTHTPVLQREDKKTAMQKASSGASEKSKWDQLRPRSNSGEIEKRLLKIQDLKQIAMQRYNDANAHIKKVLHSIRESGGEFDYSEVESYLTDLAAFLTGSENPFSYLAKEIFNYNNYLYNHSVNVCAIGTAVVSCFNINFSKIINNHLNAGGIDVYNPFSNTRHEKDIFKCYFEDDIRDISLGFFLHDIGSVLLPEKLLNKKGKLTDTEFDIIKRHSYELGVKILDRNRLKNTVVRNIIKYHHAPLYRGETQCYPHDRKITDIPAYVKICKLSDIYDAMTSKRSYKEAFNQINVLTEVFRKYAGRDKMLQYILHSFVKSIGIYPPGSIIYLKNAQMAYVLESKGPLVLPFTDETGNTLNSTSDVINIGEPDIDEELTVDSSRTVRTPLEVYSLLPSYLKP